MRDTDDVLPGDLEALLAKAKAMAARLQPNLKPRIRKPKPKLVEIGAVAASWRAQAERLPHDVLPQLAEILRTSAEMLESTRRTIGEGLVACLEAGKLPLFPKPEPPEPLGDVALLEYAIAVAEYAFDVTRRLPMELKKTENARQRGAKAVES